MEKRRIIAGLLAAAAAISVLPGAVRAADTQPLVLHRQELRDFTQDYGTILYYYDREGNCIREEWEDLEQTVEYTYRQDGTLKRKCVYKTILVEDTYYDTHGNPLKTVSYTEDGKERILTTYKNIYDEQGRMTGCTKTTELEDREECVSSGWEYGEGLQISDLEGSTILFGYYEQDGDVSNGLEPISWQILATEGTRVLAISTEGLDSRCFHDTEKSVTWEDCDLREWLNGDFLRTAFTEAEKERILFTDTGEEQDQVFLLTLEEARSYFTGNAQRLCEATEYARSRNAYVNAEGNSWWLLRTSGKNSRTIAAVYSNGSLDTGNTAVNETRGVVRPAVWLDLEDLTEPVLRFHSVTEYTLEKGVRGIHSKKRYVYDEYGGLTQYYVEKSGSYTRSYDYTNTYYLNRVLSAQCVCTDYDFDNGEDSVSEIFCSYDDSGRLIRKLRLYSGGSGMYEEIWEYDSQGNLLRMNEQGLERENNTYVPLSEALWEE